MIKRIVSAEKLAIRWLETRSKLEMDYYPQICKIAHEIITIQLRVLFAL